MSSIFFIDDLKNAIPKIGKGHPFLPDRKWSEENLDEKLNDLLKGINQNGWAFDSLKIDLEWQEKTIPAIRMSTPDWLVHFVVLEKIRKELESEFVPNTAFEISKMDALIDECKFWKKENPKAWILQTDIKSFFKNIEHDVLLKKLELKISNQLFGILSQYLDVCRKAGNELGKKGLAIGAELNYLLASSYLLSIDKVIFNSKEVLHYARYVDDVLIFCKSKKEGREVQKLIEDELDKVGLQLNYSKTKIQETKKTIHFLRQNL